MVLDQFRKDILGVTNPYTNSDNTGCCHGNHSSEATYILCRQNGIKLLSYDYELCCGKDQCDLEIATDESIIRSFIDSGNDLLDGDDLFKALHYGYGMKDSKIELITRHKISNIASYHSFQFHIDHKIMWCYFSIEIGINRNTVPL